MESSFKNNKRTPIIPGDITGEIDQRTIVIESSKGIVQYIMRGIREKHRKNLVNNKGIGHSFMHIRDSNYANAFIGNYLRLELLAGAGLYDRLEMDIRGYFDYMAKQTGTLWEHDREGASCNHGFASHVLVWLDMLGYII